MSEVVPSSPSPASMLASRRTSYGKAVVFSVAIHVGLLLAAVGLRLLEPTKPEITQKPISAKLVRLGKKRDERLLPRKETAPPPPPKTTTAPIPTPTPNPAPPKPQPKPTPSPAKPTPAVDHRQSVFDAFARTAAKPEELEGDPDGDPEGDAADAEEGERYFGLILAKARRNYGITKTIPPQELIRLKAEVVLYINATGDLLRDPVIQSSSGNEQFDQDVVMALKKAAPFGPPPQHLAKTLRSVGVAIVATP